MKPKYMLDTNICLYLMKHQPPQVRARFAECFVGDVVISAITLAELEFGVACSDEAQAHNQVLLDSLLEDILVAPFETQAARAYGPLRAANRERTQQRRAGQADCRTCVVARGDTGDQQPGRFQVLYRAQRRELGRQPLILRSNRAHQSTSPRPPIHASAGA
jgi:predicted nucleic acid-binding protein